MVGRNLLEFAPLRDIEFLTPSSSEVDLRSYEVTREYLSVTKPDLVIHAAGKVGGIQANLANKIEFLDDNLVIGRNIIMGSYHSGIKNLINLGSSCMYPKDVDGALSEDLILTGELEPTNEGYALAKVVAAKLCQKINSENPEINYKTIIPCNLYGYFDKFSPENSHLVPAVIHKIHYAKSNNDDAVEIWGDGEARREFMNTADLSSAIWKAVSEISVIPDMFNCGLGYDYSINEYYETAAKIIGWKGKFIHNLDRPVGMKRKLLDVSKQKEWGWSPTISLSEGLRTTYQYYLDNQ